MNNYLLDAFTNVWENQMKNSCGCFDFCRQVTKCQSGKGILSVFRGQMNDNQDNFFPFVKNWNQGWVKTCSSWAFSGPLSAVVFFCIGYTKQDWVIRLIDGENAQVWRTETEAWSRTNFRLCAQLILSSFFFFLKIPLFWRRTR